MPHSLPSACALHLALGTVHRARPRPSIADPCCYAVQRVEDMLEEVAEVEREIGELMPQVEAWRRKHQGE